MRQLLATFVNDTLVASWVSCSWLREADLASLRDRWGGRYCTIAIYRILSEGFLELAYEGLGADPLVWRLHTHPDALYRDRALHISA